MHGPNTNLCAQVLVFSCAMRMLVLCILSKMGALGIEPRAPMCKANAPRAVWLIMRDITPACSDILDWAVD
jgi:hypothetical protein